MSSRYRTIVAVALTVVAAGCSSDDDGNGVAVTTATTEATTTTETTTPTTSSTTATIVAPPTPAPDLLQTGDDLAAIVLSLHGYVQWLATNPDPALLAQVADPRTEVYQSFIGFIEELQGAQYRWDRPLEVLSDVEVEPRTFAGVASVRGTATSDPEARLLDVEGEVVRGFEDPPPPATLVITIALSQDGLWRLNSFEVFP